MRRNVVLSVLGLLALVGAILLIAHVTYNPLALLFDEERALTLEGAIEIAEALDRIGDQIEPPVLPATNTGLLLLAIEIVPYYHYEDISDQGLIPIATATMWALREADDDSNFHNLGTCYVGGQPHITLNARYVNSVSSWYLKSYFATLTHELGHSQGIYKLGDPNTEPATQLATLEVLAAMATDRNVWALPAFVRELQGYAEDYAWSLALQEDRLDLLRAYYRRVGDDAYVVLRFERAMNHWKSDMPRLKSILKRYGETPYRMTIEAINRRTYLTERLEPFPNAIHRIFMDDTYRSLKHLREMAADYYRVLEAYQKTHEE